MRASDEAFELASAALFSLPTHYELHSTVAYCLSVRDVHVALTLGQVKPLWVLDLLHHNRSGSMVRPDLVPAVEAVLTQAGEVR